jgi:quinol monooxygenase YgiN
MSEVSCVAISVAKPGYAEQLREALESLIDPVRKEAGVIQYEMHRDRNEPRRFVFIERWADEASFAAHVQAPHIKAYLQKVTDWLEFAEFFAMEKFR